MNTKIYSVFPACGKTWLAEHQDDFGLKILDSDSSKFSWIFRKRTDEELAKEKEVWESIPRLLSGDMFVRKIKDEIIQVRNPEFPDNYIKYIKENIGKYDYIFVSTHRSVREALDREEIDYTIVHPTYECKAEWVGRCYIREKNGEDGCKAGTMYDNWTQWYLDCYQSGADHEEIVLRPGQYLRNCL